MYTTTHLPFWLQVLERCKHSMPGSKTVFVCPTDESIDCVQSHLSETMPHGYPLPALYTLRQLMLNACPLKVAPVLPLLEKLHAVSNTLLERRTTFEHFYAWGKTLLQDFDLIDRYLIQPEELFATLVDHKQPNTAVEAKKTGYTHPTFLTKASATQQALFPENETILFWETLPLLYQMFTRNLIKEGLGYEGLCIRITATETIPKGLIDCQELVFVGFNLLTPAEVQFMEQCAMRVATSFFWDTDAHYLDNPLHPAGHYLRKHRTHPCFQAGFPSNTPTYLGDERKKVFVSETSTTLAQVQHALNALQTKTNRTGIPHSQTALAVSGTDLLLPLLEKLSDLQIPLRARLQYPLKHTIVYTIAEKVMQFWEETHMPLQNTQRAESALYAMCCLMNPLIKADVQIETNHCFQQHVQPNTPHTKSSHRLAIWNHALQQDVVTCLHLILSWLQDHFTPIHTLLLDLNRSALQHLLAFLAPWTKKMNPVDCAPSFLRTILHEQLFPFHACSTEPSLYLIDVLESHNLDFENLFILNMSEKSFPSMPFASSFLPYAIRNRFGLPIPEIEAERAASYGWYRLLQRAQTSYCSYGDVCAGPMQEKSRLLLQLEYDSPLKPIERPLSFCAPAQIRSDWTVPKDAQVMQLLAKFLVNKNEPTVSLTPSAFICYLSCPLQFYFSHLLRIRPIHYPKEQAASLQLGTFLHRVLEQLYRPWVGKKLTPAAVKQMHVRVKQTIQEVVTDRATQDASIQTPQLLAALLEKLVEKQLERDAKDAPFTLIGVEMGSETPLTLPLQLGNGQTVQLGGIIDRVDAKEDTIRIIDYKTGTPNAKLSSLEILWDHKRIQQNKASLQLVFYAWLFQSTQKTAATYRIMPCLMSIREHFVGTYVPGLWLQDGKNARTYSKIEDITPYTNDFQNKLIEMLTHLFDPNLPFTQTNDLAICDRCPYISICQRERVR